MSILNSLKFARTSSFKAIGAVAAFALGASVFTAAPASAVADDFEVYAYPTGIDAAQVCVNFNVGNPYISGISVFIDTDESDAGVTATIATPTTTGGCDYNASVTMIRDSDGNIFDQNDSIYFGASAFVVDALPGAIDGTQYGSSYYYETDYFYYSLDINVYAELAVDSELVTDERHTARVCLDYNGSVWDGFNNAATIVAYNDTDNEVEALDYDVYWSDDAVDFDCQGRQMALVYDLELGDRYVFNAYAVQYDNYGEGQTNYDNTYGYSNGFIAVDVSSGQHDLYPTSDNGGQDGNYNDDTSEDNGYNQGYIEIVTPAGVDVNEDYGDFDVYTYYGYNDNSTETSSDSEEYYEDYTIDEFVESADYNGEYDGQIYVDFDLYEYSSYDEYNNTEDDDVFQGLSDTYLDNNNQNFDDGMVRATSDTSLEIAFESTLSQDTQSMNAGGEDRNTNVFLDAADATYYVRAVPNLGDIATYQNEGGGREANYLGNDDFDGNDDDVQRFYVKDFVFESAASEGVEAFDDVYDVKYWNGNNYYTTRGGVVKMTLTGLEPGTFYSIQIMTTAMVDKGFTPVGLNPANGGLDINWTEYRDGGDGGYDYVEFRDSRYFYASTFLESSVDNITKNSVRLLANITDSHAADYFDQTTRGYFSVNPCDYEEGELEMVWNCTDTTDSFNVPTTSLVSLEYVNVGTERFAAIEIEGLEEGRKYEVAFGAEYWADNHNDGADYDGGDWYDWYDGELSYRQAFIDTFDTDMCDSDARFYGGEDDARNCFNGGSQNEIYRTAVMSFVTADETSPGLYDWDADFDGELVNLGSDIELMFDENIMKGAGSIQIINTDTSDVLETINVSSWRVSIEDEFVSINPNRWLDADTNYIVVITPGAFVDASGNHSVAIDGKNIAFTTVEESAVIVEDVDFSEGIDGVAIDTDIQITFNTEVMAGNGVIEIRRASNNKLVQSFTAGAASSVSIDGDVVTIDRGDNYSYGVDYYVYIAPGAFVDANGTAYAGNLNETIKFTTESKPATVGSIKVSASTRGFRDFSIKLGSDLADETVSVYRYDRFAGQMVLIRTLQTDENGNFDFTYNVPRLVVNDNVYVVFGRHAVATQLVTRA
ncbi:MAG: hypothetical protein RLZZ426_1286 [Actinomycetota bacterium]